jgi:hypothetical protein
LKGLPLSVRVRPAVEERVVPEHVLDELGAELEVLAEERLVGRELHERAVALVGLGEARLALELALRKLDDLGLALAHGLRAVVDREGVDGLLADAVEADGLLKVSLSYFAPVLMIETQSTSFPSGMPRP